MTDFLMMFKRRDVVPVHLLLSKLAVKIFKHIYIASQGSLSTGLLEQHYSVQVLKFYFVETLLSTPFGSCPYCADYIPQWSRRSPQIDIFVFMKVGPGNRQSCTWGSKRIEDEYWKVGIQEAVFNSPMLSNFGLEIHICTKFILYSRLPNRAGWWGW